MNEAQQIDSLARDASVRATTALYAYHTRGDESVLDEYDDAMRQLGIAHAWAKDYAAETGLEIDLGSYDV